jgi:Fur family ferric uptake transcriptional regulator
MVAARVRWRLGKVSTQSICDLLGALGDAGLVRRVEPTGRSALYERRVGDNHHQLVLSQLCCGCRRRLRGKAPCLEPRDSAGYLVDEAEVVYWGRCPECLARSASV